MFKLKKWLINKILSENLRIYLWELNEMENERYKHMSFRSFSESKESVAIEKEINDFFKPILNQTK